MKKDKIDGLYKQLKNIYKENKYKSFFNYFSRAWLGQKYPNNLWNFYAVVNEENTNKIINFHFTNNLFENMDHYKIMEIQWKGNLMEKKNITIYEIILFT